MKKTATIYDYARMCKAYKHCRKCPFASNNNGAGLMCNEFIYTFPDKTNEIILNWCKEHPIKTRQDGFLEMFPNAEIYTDGVLKIKPCYIDKGVKCDSHADCLVCRDKYWLAEVEE